MMTCHVPLGIKASSMNGVGTGVGVGDGDGCAANAPSVVRDTSPVSIAAAIKAKKAVPRKRFIIA
jgi:hypothetical protein